MILNLTSSPKMLKFKKKVIFLIEVQLFYMMLVSGVQKSDSDMVYVCSFQICFPYRLLKKISSFLCYRVGP